MTCFTPSGAHNLTVLLHEIGNIIPTFLPLFDLLYRPFIYEVGLSELDITIDKRIRDESLPFTRASTAISNDALDHTTLLDRTPSVSSLTGLNIGLFVWVLVINFY